MTEPGQWFAELCGSDALRFCGVALVCGAFLPVGMLALIFALLDPWNINRLNFNATAAVGLKSSLQPTFPLTECHQNFHKVSLILADAVPSKVSQVQPDCR